MSKWLFHWICLHDVSAFLLPWIPNRMMDFAGRLLLLFSYIKGARGISGEATGSITPGQYLFLELRP